MPERVESSASRRNEVRRPSRGDCVIQQPMMVSSTEGSIGAFGGIDTKVQSTSAGKCSIFQSSLFRKAASFGHRPTVVVEEG
jgi:hypothetical protein